MATNITTTTQTTKSREKYIDIHCHLINEVDDGAKNLEQSLRELIIAHRIGLKKIICTSHICHGQNDRLNKIKTNFDILKEYGKKLNIDLYFGNEILYNHDIPNLLKSGKISSLNNSNYILVEFKRSENRDFEDILSCLEDLIDNGYVVVLAHPELYHSYNKLKYIKALKKEGILLQLDAKSILKRRNRKVYKFSKKLLRKKLIDFVASDNHCNKERNYYTFKKAYKKIKRRYNKEYVNDIFYNNPKMILNSVK